MSRARLSLLTYLAWSDLQRRYAGTKAGILWTILAPVALIGAMWFALDIGLGMRAAGPAFGVNLVIGMVAWLAFSESVGDATGCVLRSPHLVKKVVFPVELLPLASVMSSFAVHLCLLAVLIAALALQGQAALGMIWTLPFWMALSAVMAAGLGFAVAGLNVIVRDTQAVAPFLVTVWFWLTPIVWPFSRIEEPWRWLGGLNPMAVVVEGYRTALTGAPYPFEPLAVIAAVAISIAVGAAGYVLFATLRPSFPDSL